MNSVPIRLPAQRLAAWLLLGTIIITTLAACVTDDDLTSDQRAYTLDRELMCPVCDGQTLDQSHAQIAEDMKEILRDKIAEGDSNQDIKDYFVARYGEVVLASPEASGFNLIVWVMPILIGGGGALAVVWVLKNMRRNSARMAATHQVTLEDIQLQQYLDKVDRDIGVRRGDTDVEGPEGRESETG